MVKQHTSSGGSAKLLVAKDLAGRHLEAHITRGMHLRRQKLQNLQDLEKARAVKQAWVTGYTTLLKRLFEGNAVADACNDWVGKIFPEYAHPNLFIENFYEEIDQRLQRLQAVAERVAEMPDRVVDVAGESGGMSSGMSAGSGGGMSGGGMSSGGMSSGMSSGMSQGGMSSGMSSGGMSNGMQGGMSSGMSSGMQGGMAGGMSGGAPGGMTGGMPGGAPPAGGSRMDAAPMQPQARPAEDEAEEEAEEEQAPPARYAQPAPPAYGHGPVQAQGYSQVLGRGNGQAQPLIPKSKPQARPVRGPQQAEHVNAVARGLLISVAEQDVAGGVVKKFLNEMSVDLSLLNAPADGGEDLVAAIEALEKANNVSFALVSVSEDEAAARVTDDLELQDGGAVDRVAIFLLGFLAGKMGLKRVCVLHPSGCHPTPDPLGMTHISVDDAGGWQLQLARQLKRAGVHLDLNRLC